MSPKPRFRVAVSVYGVLVKKRSVLLMRREGSGYRDGWLSLPSGHLEDGENLITGLQRELHEELNIDIDTATCKLAILVHRGPESKKDREYLDIFFQIGRWSGDPSIAEPDKCSELLWADLDHLPNDLLDYVAAAMKAIDEGGNLLLFGWESASPSQETRIDRRRPPTL